MKEKLKAILERYGSIAFVTYFAIFGLVLAGFFFALLWGFQVADVDRGVGVGGALFAAWAATKLTQPLRILATLALTPLIAAVFKARSAEKPPEEATPPQ